MEFKVDRRFSVVVGTPVDLAALEQALVADSARAPLV